MIVVILRKKGTDDIPGYGGYISVTMAKEMRLLCPLMFPKSLTEFSGKPCRKQYRWSSSGVFGMYGHVLRYYHLMVPFVERDLEATVPHSVGILNVEFLAVALI